jgi:MoeA N-terminal region (domain I and II)
MKDILTMLRSLARQEQFLEVVDRDEATTRFQRHLRMRPLGAETVPLFQSPGRVLARAVIADVDVPGFDRSSVDGFAVRADDTTGASERQPKRLVLNAEILTPGTVPAIAVQPGTATLIATGAWCRAAPTPSSWSSIPRLKTRATPLSSKCVGPWRRDSSSPSPAAILLAAKPSCAPARY